MTFLTPNIGGVDEISTHSLMVNQINTNANSIDDRSNIISTDDERIYDLLSIGEHREEGLSQDVHIVGDFAYCFLPNSAHYHNGTLCLVILAFLWKIGLGKLPYPFLSRSNLLRP